MLMLSPTPITGSWFLYVGVVLWRFFVGCFVLIFSSAVSQNWSNEHALPSGFVLFTFTDGSRCVFSFMQTNDCDMYVTCVWPGRRCLAGAACEATLGGFVCKGISACSSEPCSVSPSQEECFQLGGG